MFWVLVKHARYFGSNCKICEVFWGTFRNSEEFWTQVVKFARYFGVFIKLMRYFGPKLLNLKGILGI